MEIVFFKNEVTNSAGTIKPSKYASKYVSNKKLHSKEVGSMYTVVQ